LNPDEGGYLNNMGLICKELGMRMEAKEFLSEAVRRCPDNEDIRKNYESLDDDKNLGAFMLLTLLGIACHVRKNNRRH